MHVQYTGSLYHCDARVRLKDGGEPGQADGVDDDLAGDERDDGLEDVPVPAALGEPADDGCGEDHADHVAEARAGEPGDPGAATLRARCRAGGAPRHP